MASMAENPTGVLCIVKTPYSQHVTSSNEWLELQSREAVAHCIIDENQTRIKGCSVGYGYTLIEVDEATAIDLSQNWCVPGMASITSLVTESTSITFKGDVLAKVKLSDIENAVHSSLKVTYSSKDSVLTITGFWCYVQKARQVIQSLLLQSIELNTQGTMKHTSKSEEIHNIHPLACSDTSQYDMITDVSSDVIALMKHNHVGFQPGVEYNSVTNTVHFTFSSQADLSKAMHKFEEAYDNLNEFDVGHCSISIPCGMHSEEIGIMISQLENSYDDTIINWIPENLEIFIISTAVDKVKAKMTELMETREFKYEEKSSKGGVSDWIKKMNVFSHSKHKSVFTPAPYKPFVKIVFGNGRSLLLRNGDLLEESVDAIVNPANRHLNHGAGIAKQIDELSGNIIRHHCKQVLKDNNGSIPTGTAVVTEAGGKLKCFYVIHAVGPNAHEIKSMDDCARLLKSAVNDALKRGFEKHIKSLAVPAISSGVFGMDKDVVAETIIDTLVDYQKKPHADILNDIRIVVWDKETYLPFLNYLTSIKASLDSHK